MPQQVEVKQIDPEAELSNVQFVFKKLAPQCSVEKRAAGIPQLAPQEKQLGLLAGELKETMMCINLARKGQHALRDRSEKRCMKKVIIDYEKATLVLNSENKQQSELDCLNYLTEKQLIGFKKIVPGEADEMIMIEKAQSRLRQMENRLEIATKRFCMVSADNQKMRQEIHRLLGERNTFNIQWNRTIGKLVKGKEYLMDIFEIANKSFGERDECCKRLDAVKVKGLFQLNKDISEMQAFEGELNHLAKLEEFLRLKGSKRICEADELKDIAAQEEISRCEKQIQELDRLLETIFHYSETERITTIISRFRVAEIQNFSIFNLLCEVLQETIFISKEQEVVKQNIVDQREINKARVDTQNKRIEHLRSQLEASSSQLLSYVEKNNEANERIVRTLKGISELIELTKSDVSPLLALLGNHRDITTWNVTKFLRILEAEIKSIIEIVYGAVKEESLHHPCPTCLSAFGLISGDVRRDLLLAISYLQPPAPTPKPPAQRPSVAASAAAAAAAAPVKLVGDPRVVELRPNRIEYTVPYQPCAYCVEDYIMNQVFETPAVPADNDYVQSIFHLEENNTKFGIYTLTIPTKRHPYRKKE